MKDHILLLLFCVSVLTGCKYAEILGECDSCSDSCAARLACPCKKSELIGEWGGRFEPQKVPSRRFQSGWRTPYSNNCELAMVRFSEDNKFTAYYRKKKHDTTLGIEHPHNFKREELVYHVECDKIVFRRDSSSIGASVLLAYPAKLAKFYVTDDTITFVIFNEDYNTANETIVLHRMPNGSIEKLKTEFESSIRVYEQYIKEWLEQGD